MSIADITKRHGVRFQEALLIVAIIVLSLTGCLPGTKPPLQIDLYTLEYTVSALDGISPVHETIRIDRFSIAQSYNSTAMIYRPAPYKLGVYNGHKWRVNPADLVTDHLLRDIRTSGMFRGVFSYRDPEKTRFVVEGSVEEFLEVDNGNTGKALLGVTITLLDTREKEVTKRLIFQRKYRVEETMKEQNPGALAQGMSNAMASISGRILKDLSEVTGGIAK